MLLRLRVHFMKEALSAHAALVTARPWTLHLDPWSRAAHVVLLCV